MLRFAQHDVFNLPPLLTSKSQQPTSYRLLPTKFYQLNPIPHTSKGRKARAHTP